MWSDKLLYQNASKVYCVASQKHMNRCFVLFVFIDSCSRKCDNIGVCMKIL